MEGPGAARRAQLTHAAPVPVWDAAGGPRTLRMAGQVADGVFVRVGRHPANLRAAIDAVRAGATPGGPESGPGHDRGHLPHRAGRRPRTRRPDQPFHGRRILRVLASTVRPTRLRVERTARRGTLVAPGPEGPLGVATG
ncbi:LLM class flavin-dependent oxidoreductase [Streptomyces sp. A1-5]|uniref:LLM class flavin-dependent oxidoreductase n=1 Tax=Streptomyces sp. A1-5 TaxID=2738410 RepID=UPI003FA695AC